MRLPVRLPAIAVFLAAFVCSPVLGQTLKVGSKDFTEQFIVAELYAASLEAAGISVERKINLGPTAVAHAALLSGAIDLYPEYTGTALGAVMKVATNSFSPKEVFQQVKDTYEREYKLLWIPPPSAVNNSYVLVVRLETAQAMKLTTLSDLARVSKSLKIGAGGEFGQRRDGLRGLAEVYGIEFGEYRQFPELRGRYEALRQQQVDVVDGFATDWQLAAAGLVALADDKELFPPYLLAPVARMDTVATNKAAMEALARVSSLIDNDVMRELNRQVDMDKKDPRQVAEAFLKEKGLTR
jgi:osmoprotectant transport system substrate-binding protein